MLFGLEKKSYGFVVMLAVAFGVVRELLMGGVDADCFLTVSYNVLVLYDLVL